MKNVNISIEKVLQKVKQYIVDGGGAVQFHDINEICLSIEEGILSEVIECKATKENPFGIGHRPIDIAKDEDMLRKVYIEIHK